MRFIDAHLHTDMIEDKQLQKLVMMGMEAAIVPSPHMYLGNKTSEDVLQMWDRFLGFERESAETMGFELFTSLSVPFLGVSKSEAEKCLARLPEYLKADRAVALGEIGMDTANDFEKWLFREHLAIAKDAGLPVILHTPIRMAPQSERVLPQVLEIIQQEGFPVEKCVFDHASEPNLDWRASTGAMVGLSICWDKMPPETAARYVIDNPDKRDKIIINSELGGEGNDYFMVPRVILAMKLMGLDKATIDKVCWQNPKDFFKLAVE